MAEEPEESRQAGKDQIQVVLQRIEKKSDITLFIAILILVVSLCIATAVAPQAMAGLFVVVFGLAAAIGIITLPILFVFKAFRGRRTEERSDEEAPHEPAENPET